MVFFKVSILQNLYQFLKCLKVDPNHAGAYFNLGNVYKKMGLIDAAILNYKKSISINSDYFEALVNLSNSFRDTGDLNASIFHLQKSLSNQSKII